MAIPPEPLSELLGRAGVVVVAEVVEVVSVGTLPERPARPPGFVDSPHPLAPAQTVKLRVSRALRGDAATELLVEKAAGAYRLAVGDSGVFFVAAGKLLGRYGPTTYPLASVEAALAQR